MSCVIEGCKSHSSRKENEDESFTFHRSNSDSSSDDDLTTSIPSARLAPTPPLANIVKFLERSEGESPAPAPFKAVLRSTRVLLQEPGKRDMTLYKRYVKFSRRSSPHSPLSAGVVLTVSSALRIDSSIDVIPPTVSRAAHQLYCEHVQRASARLHVPRASHALYHKYVSCTI